jgi:hypothetical protein
VLAKKNPAGLGRGAQEQYEERGESDCAERHRRRHVPQHGPAVLANSILRAVYRASGCAVAFSLGRDLLVNIGNGFHERPEFRIGLKLGLRSDPTRYSTVTIADVLATPFRKADSGFHRMPGNRTAQYPGG